MYDFMMELLRGKYDVEIFIMEADAIVVCRHPSPPPSPFPSHAIPVALPVAICARCSAYPSLWPCLLQSIPSQSIPVSIHPHHYPSPSQPPFRRNSTSLPTASHRRCFLRCNPTNLLSHQQSISVNIPITSYPVNLPIVVHL